MAAVALEAERTVGACFDPMGQPTDSCAWDEG